MNFISIDECCIGYYLEILETDFHRRSALVALVPVVRLPPVELWRTLLEPYEYVLALHQPPLLLDGVRIYACAQSLS